MFGSLRFTVSLCAVLISICHAHLLPPPTNLKENWTDDLTINVSWSWQRPKNVSVDCEVMFDVMRNESSQPRYSRTHFQDMLLAESAAVWVYSVQAVGTSSSCRDWRSEAAVIRVEAPGPRAALTDFKCYLSNSDLNCSWISDPASPVTLFYRDCDTTPGLREKKLSNCTKLYTDGNRKGCHLIGGFLQRKLCMVAKSPKGISTFKAPKAVKLPHMKISEEGTTLTLTFEPLVVSRECSYYNICYSVCDGPIQCNELWQNTLPIVPYVKSCQYKFRYRVQTIKECEAIYSDWREEIIPGSADRTMTVVTVLIPIIVSACVILSCICFRRHKDIICPEVPDPSSLFKEMINKEIKPNVYTPVQEPVEPIVIVPHISQRPGLVQT